MERAEKALVFLLVGIPGSESESRLSLENCLAFDAFSEVLPHQVVHVLDLTSSGYVLGETGVVKIGG